MADIKVFYFDEVRGRGEFIRMLLTAAGQKFEDVRIKMAGWRNDPDYKKESPYGKLPYMIYNGKKYGQSIPIVTYLAKKFGFYVSTVEDELRQGEVMGLVEDLRVPFIRDWFFASDPEKKAEIVRNLKEDLFPRFLGYFQALLAENGDTGFFTGNSMTVADMYVYDLLETILGIDPEALKKFPLVQKLSTNVKTSPALKDYLEGRPKCII